MELSIKNYKIVIKNILLIFLCNYFIINNSYGENITISTVGASLTGGITDYSYTDAKNINNDNIIDQIKKKTHIISFITYLYPNRTLAKIILGKQKKTNKSKSKDKVTVLDSFTQSYLSCTHPVKSLGNIFFISVFLNTMYYPLESLKMQLFHAERNKANIVIGIDMLFWPVYNNYLSNSDIKQTDDEYYSKQLKQLNQVLNYLDKPENENINFVVGYVPHRAIRFFSRNLEPTKELIDAANTRIDEWAAARNKKDNGKVLLIDITNNFFDHIKKYEEFLNIKTPLLVDDLICIDGLHPSPKGQDIIVKYILKSMAFSKYDIFRRAGLQFNY
jgi:lysophospholipase L1-like esterase